MSKYKKSSIHSLFQDYAEIMDELKDRDVVRTFNNPVADYAEWLVSKNLKLDLETNSKAGYDAKDSTGTRFQVKCRRLSSSNSSRQLGVIRKLKDKEFEYLIGVLFYRDFSVKEAYQIPHKIIEKYAKYSDHQHGHILQLKGELLKDSAIKDITGNFK
jgi:uncharacterized protein DUF6998